MFLLHLIFEFATFLASLLLADSHETRLNIILAYLIMGVLFFGAGFALYYLFGQFSAF